MSGLQKPNIGGPGGTAVGTSFDDAAQPHIGTNVQSALSTIKKSGLSAVLYVDPNIGDNATARRGSIVNKFLTVQAAITAAQTGDVVLLGPGVYAEVLTLKSGITVKGVSARSVIIDGNVTYAPTSAVAALEAARLVTLSINQTLTFDSTGKPVDSSKQAIMTVEDCGVNTITVIGRDGFDFGDQFYLFNHQVVDAISPLLNPVVTVTNSYCYIADSFLDSLVGHGDATLYAQMTALSNGITLDGDGANFDLQGVSVGGDINMTGVNEFSIARNSELHGNIVVTAASSTLDARSSRINPSRTITGAGSVIRDQTNKRTLSMTKAAARDLFTLPLAAGQMIGGFIDFVIKSSDGTDHQSVSGRARWTAVNKAGTIVSDVASVVDVSQARSAGTITFAFACFDATNAVTLRATATPSLTPTTLAITFEHDES